MRLRNLPLLLLLTLALSGCASPIPSSAKPIEVAPPKLPPPPADVMVTRKADFLERMILRFSSPSLQKPTP